MTSMASTLLRAARSYWQNLLNGWRALRPSRVTVDVLIGVYLVACLGLTATGHLTAAGVATLVLGIPLLLLAWT